jgi:uncharacterized protein (DUF488 family)
MKIFTIGFTQKSAETFFGLLRQPGLVRLVDVRLNNVSQLAGFAKKNDLRFFVEAINGIAYSHLPELAPSAALLQDYKSAGGDWSMYEKQFMALMAERDVESSTPRSLLDGGCLLCSEASPAHCHRRLVAEYLQAKWGGLEIQHLE